jgi:acetate kinase
VSTATPPSSTMVLVLNCGSSSVKYEVLEVGTTGSPRRLRQSLIERVGEAAVPDHGAAIRTVLEEVHAAHVRVDAVGHRVVHGGERFTRATLIDDAVIAAIAELETLAPLHNAPSLAGIRGARAELGGAVPMVAVFDTAFHATLPAQAARYALPDALARRHGIRRYGFHGSSYRSVLARYAALAATTEDRATLVALHLGNGCSAAAIKDGRSVDTSMGFTPLEGLVMGTRSGDLDPAIVAHLARVESVPPQEVERWLNERSGLLGVSGQSRDMRELLAREAEDPAARLAIELFCYRAKKYVGAYLAALGGADAVVFTGGIGEHAAVVRARICEGMSWCGIRLDPARNARAIGVEARISVDGTRPAVFVIPADEAGVIARETVRCLTGGA